MNEEQEEQIHTVGEFGEQRENPYGHIRSFVLRQGRVSNAQLRYYVDMMEKIGVPYVSAPPNLDTVFGRSSEVAPKILEIGFGMGETSAAISAANPQNDYLGIEVHTPGVGSLCKLIAEMGLTNQRIVQHDAVEVLRDMIQPEALSGVPVFFPDPWPKARHHKRRLVTPSFAELVARVLRPGGVWRLATDWRPYAEEMIEVIGASPDFEPLEPGTDGTVARFDGRVLTSFEAKGLRAGREATDLAFRRRDRRS